MLQLKSPSQATHNQPHDFWKYASSNLVKVCIMLGLDPFYSAPYCLDCLNEMSYGTQHHEAMNPYYEPVYLGPPQIIEHSAYLHISRIPILNLSGQPLTFLTITITLSLHMTLSTISSYNPFTNKTTLRTYHPRKDITHNALPLLHLQYLAPCCPLTQKPTYIP